MMIAKTAQQLMFRFLALNKRKLPGWMQRPFRLVRGVGYDHVARSHTVASRRIANLISSHAILVNQPLVLISQIPRSGGTLLSQLFDGHPECYAHPSELRIGKPKREWPKLDASQTPALLFDRLFERNIIRAVVKGYRKGRHADRKCFVFSTALQRQIFVSYLNRLSNRTPRDIFDAYFTSYFNAWLNYQTAFDTKKIITAFVPGLSAHPQSVSAFFAAYPDGRIISIVRDPLSWFPSLREHGVNPRQPEIKSAMLKWCRNANSIALNKSNYGSRYCIIKFDDLILETESTMRFLAQWLGISFDSMLTTPTFNTAPVQANSSFPVATTGIIAETTGRQNMLAKTERDYIESVAMPLYRRLANLTTLQSPLASAIVACFAAC